MRSSSSLLLLVCLAACQGTGREGEARILPRLPGGPAAASRGGEPGATTPANAGTQAAAAPGPKGAAQPGQSQPIQSQPGQSQPGQSQPGEPKPGQLPPGIEAAPAGLVDLREVNTWVIALGRKAGRDGLRALPPGKTLRDRLRYCYAATVLDEPKRVDAQIRAVHAWRSEDPAVAFVYGRHLIELGQPAEARRVFRQAYPKAKAEGLARYPGFVEFYASALLHSTAPAEREEAVLVLREELASGARPGRAATLLSSVLCEEERHREALECLELARRRSQAPAELDRHRAQVCFDLYRWKEAKEILAKVADDDVRGLYLRFKVLTALGELEAAEADLNRLSGLKLGDSDAALVTQLRASFVRMREQKVRRNPSGEELFAILRGAPDSALRLRTLKVFTGAEKLEPAIRQKALSIAWNCDDPLVRTAALRSLVQLAAKPMLLLVDAVADPDKRVRGAAAGILGRVVGEEHKRAGELLRRRLQIESEPYVFECLHNALRRSTGKSLPLPFGAASTEEGRQGVRAAWNKQT